MNCKEFYIDGHDGGLNICVEQMEGRRILCFTNKVNDAYRDYEYRVQRWNQNLESFTL